MSNSITKLLVHAKQQNKWIPRSVLTMNNFSLKAIHHLEDEGYLLGHHCNDRGALIKLTLKGYKYFSNQVQHVEIKD